MSKRVKIVLAEPSAIVRKGLAAILRQSLHSGFEIVEIEDISSLQQAVIRTKPDIVVINPLSTGIVPFQQIRKENQRGGIKFVALLTALTDNTALGFFDESVSLYENAETIGSKIARLGDSPDATSGKQREALSQREKEVIACVIKGMTNKQIADVLCLSAHTVISHRRNISAKLDIHTTAGLTIYAILNKLVELDEESIQSGNAADISDKKTDSQK